MSAPPSASVPPPAADDRRAWLLAATAGAANFVTFGSLFSFGVFLNPIARSFDTSNGPVALAFSVAVCIYYASGAVGGRLADRRGVNPVLVTSGVLFPLGLVLSSRADTLWQVYLAFCPLVGVAVSGCYAPLIGAVGRAFGSGGDLGTGQDRGDVGRRRALGISVVLVGVGAGTLVMPSVCQALVEAYGWRTTFLVIAALGAGVIAATGLAAAAVAARAPATASSPGAAAPMWRSPRFRRLYVSVILIGPGFYAPLAFASDYAVDEGISPRAAAALIGVMGGSSVAARLAFGSVIERVGPLNLYRLGYLLMLGGLAVWLGAGSSYLLLLVAAGLHGLGWAAWVTATPLVLAGWFGLTSLGGALGTFYTGLGIGALIGPGISGFVIDRSGYGLAIALIILAAAAACALALLPLPDPSPREPRRLVSGPQTRRGSWSRPSRP